MPDGADLASLPARVGEHSPAGVGLYLSALVEAPPVATRVPLACAVAVAEALASLVPQVTIKWPNDVLAPDGRKLAGILCEGLSRARAVVVGVGVDVGHEQFPAELAPHAVSLRMLGADAERGEVALALIGALDAWLPRAVTDWQAVQAAWRARCGTLGQPVRVGELEGTAVDLDDDGALVVEDARGRRQRVVAGDVEMER